jgi:Ca2+/H+ antiporter, TMEM165/GDT1 family
MQALLISLGVTALAEVGDKTQVMALMLAAKYRRPFPILLAILVATSANHALAGALGAWVGAHLAPYALRLIVGVSLLAMGAWVLVPERSALHRPDSPRYGVFLTSLVTFFVLEFGDKTQIATAALAARFATLWPVIVGSVLGVLIADLPAVLLGHRAARRLPLTPVRAAAAAMLAVLGALTLAGAG